MEAADVVAVPVPPNENPADVPVILAVPPVPKLNAILNPIQSLFKINENKVFQFFISELRFNESV